MKWFLVHLANYTSIDLIYCTKLFKLLHNYYVQRFCPENGCHSDEEND